MAQTNLKQSQNQTFNAVGGSHARSPSQPTLFANHCLPPLSPLPHSESSSAFSSSNLKNVSIEEINVSSLGPAAFLTSPRGNLFNCNDGLPPHRGHRRSNSDVPLGFSAMIQSSPQLIPTSSHEILGGTMNMRVNSGNDNKPIGPKRREMDTITRGKNSVETQRERKPEGEVRDNLSDSLMNLDHVDALNSSGANDKDKDAISSGAKMSGADSSNSESETVSRHCTNSSERIKRTASGDIVRQFMHSRSLSTDSGIGHFHVGDSSPKLQMSLWDRSDKFSPSNSLNENSDKINLDFGHGEFNEVEMKKIMADEKLAEIALSDRKRAKRILANRQSAARSKERKLHYISELEHKVQALQTVATNLSARNTILQKDRKELTNQNNELKLRIQAMEQQAQLRDDLHETLFADVQRLKLANMEFREEGRTSNGIEQYVPIKHHGFHMLGRQPNQTQRLSVITTTTSTTTAAAPASA